MSVIFNTSTESLVRTTNLIPKTCNMTVMFFFRYIATPGGPPTFNTQWYWGDNPATTYNDYVFIGVNTSDAITMDVSIDGTGSVESYALPDFGLYHIAYVRKGTTHELWVNGVKEISQVLDINVAAFTAPTHQMLGGDTLAADWDDGEYAYYKEWTVALTSQEIISEMQSGDFAVVKTANLHVNTPLVADILDDSGNGYDWSVFAGSNTFTTGPLNQDEENARPVINIPIDFDQNAHFGGTTYGLWYKYVATSAELVIGGWGFGDLVSYLPGQFVYTGSVGSLSILLLLSNIVNKPTAFPVTSGTIYYFRFEQVSGDPTPALLLLDITTAPLGLVPIGSIFVNDDSSGYPAILLDRTGQVLNYISPLHHGEAGDVLADNGYSLIEDRSTNEIKSYDSQFNLDKTLAFDTPSVVRIRAQQTLDVFYVSNNNNPSVPIRTVSNVGVLSSVIATITSSTGLLSLAANNAGTILYYGRGTADSTVRLWDLVGDTDLGTFATGPSSKLVFDILVLADDTVLVSYEVFGVTPWEVRHYNSAGTLLDTYSLPQSTTFGADPRLAYAIDDPNSFWVWTHTDAADSRFLKVKVSDGSFLLDFSLPEYKRGKLEGTANADPARFGPSVSCPFFITRGPGPPTTPPTPPGTPEIIPPGNTDGTILVGSGTVGGGLYELVPDKTDDTLWVTQSPEATQDVKKPDPTATLGDIGQ